MYAAFARLNYTPWFALAEFVDNSVQSALTNLVELHRVHPNGYKLRVEIVLTSDSLEIRDNAAGISSRDYQRAFRPAAVPPDTSGLSEFGLGMKAAASWFAEKWTVRTSALGECVERTICFDIPTIVRTNTDQLEPTEVPARREDHYTSLRLERLRIHPKGRTLTKIAEHLASIYRLFIADGFLELSFNGEVVRYMRPEFLIAPFHAKPVAEPIEWRKDFQLDFGDGRKVRGWAGILARASVANAGFAVFRRRRLVVGSHGEGYRPEAIFGKPNKFVYQRLVGEIEVDGFSVSHTKDGIQWSDWEEDILQWLKDELDREPIRLLQQAEHYRARTAPNRDVIGEALRDTGAAVAQHLRPVVEEQLETEPREEDLPEQLDSQVEDSVRTEIVKLDLQHAGLTWSISIEITSDPGQEGWYEIAECHTTDSEVRLEVRINLAHPFLARFVSPDGEEIVPFTRLAAGLAVAEITARHVGVRHAGMIRTNLNQILRRAFSGPVGSWD